MSKNKNTVSRMLKIGRIQERLIIFVNGIFKTSNRKQIKMLRSHIKNNNE